MEKPERGFYYHYKHNPEDIYDHAYEIVNVSRHTETEEYLVVYRPFYKSDFLEHADASARPIGMFMDMVTKLARPDDLSGRSGGEGATFPRFQKITDPEIIKKLEQKRDEMYP